MQQQPRTYRTLWQKSSQSIKKTRRIGCVHDYCFGAAGAIYHFYHVCQVLMYKLMYKFFVVISYFSKRPHGRYKTIRTVTTNQLRSVSHHVFIITRTIPQLSFITMVGSSYQAPHILPRFLVSTPEATKQHLRHNK